MGERDVSLESIVQRRVRAPGSNGDTRSQPGTLATIVVITHDTTEEAIRKALDAIEGDGKVAEPPQMIRIERL